MTENSPEAQLEEGSEKLPDPPEPLPFEFQPAHRILHPVTGSVCFGQLEVMRSRGEVVPAGEIYLPAGKHHGPNHGYGVRHIWAEHAVQLSKLGYSDIHEVARFVSDIIQSGAPVYCEFGRLRSYRPVVLRTKLGQVILEQRYTDKYDTLGTSFYTVVTAFDGNRVHGTVIGKVK